MLTIDMILAMSEAEILATPIGDLSECLLVARNRMHMAFAGFDEADSNLSALAAETVPESTGTAVDEVYDFEAGFGPLGAGQTIVRSESMNETDPFVPFPCIPT